MYMVRARVRSGVATYGGDRPHGREGEEATGEGAEPRILRLQNSLTACLPYVYANKKPPPWLTRRGQGAKEARA